MSTSDSEVVGYGSKQHAHNIAKERDVRRFFQSGERIEVFVRTPPEQNGGGDAVAKINQGECRDVVVFVEPGSHTLLRGSRVRCRITHVDESFIKALAVYRLD